MTHSLHRIGKEDSLHDYFIILFRIAPDVKEQQLYNGEPKDRARQVISILEKIPIEALDAETTDGYLRFMNGWEENKTKGFHKSSNLKDIYSNSSLTWVRHVVIKGQENLTYMIKELSQLDLGISVVVSGLFEEIKSSCVASQVYPHSVNMSLGIWGKKSLLPDQNSLEMITMCGHSLISSNLIKVQAQLVMDGEISRLEAAVELGKQCTCNIFNVERAIKLLSE